MAAQSEAARVSVVIPCYNAAAFLPAAIASALGQSHPPGEVILIDDGSHDDTPRIAQRHGSAVVYVRQANQGISAARNHGIARASFPTIGFLDADDLWPQHSLAARLRVLQADPEIGCVFGTVTQFSTTPPTSIASRPGRLAGAMLARRSVFDRIGTFDPQLRIGETLDWIARLDDSAIATRMIDEIVLHRRIHADNTVRDTAKQTDYLRALRASLHRRRAAAGQP